MSDKPTINVTIHDEVKCQFIGIDKTTIDYLYNKFSLFVENYKFNPRFQLGVWDGKKQFFTKQGQTFVYLMPEIISILKSRNYNIEIIDNRSLPFYDVSDPIEKDYFSHIINKKTKKPYLLTDHQHEAINKMLPIGSGIALAGTGFGKAQPLYCKILTPTGWTTMGDIKSGDLIFTPKNTVARVVNTFDQGVTDVYKINLDDGGVTYSHIDHLWKIYNQRWLYSGEEPFSVISTIEIMDVLNNTSKDVYLPVIPIPINFKKYDYHIDPYIAGCILPFVEIENDQLIIKERKASTHTHSEIKISNLIDTFKQNGIIIKYYDKIGRLEAENSSGRFIIDAAKATVINQMEIPTTYVFCDSNDRLRFLQGACDVGGTLSKNGQISLSIPNTRIKNQIREMILLQGGCLDPLNNRSSYNKRLNSTIYFTHHYPDAFFTELSKKKHYILHKTDNRSKLSKNRKIVSIEHIGQEPTRCIYIDDVDHLYITDDCIITHNTILNATMCDVYAKKGCKTLTIVPATTLINQTIAQFKDLGLSVGHYNSENQDLEPDHIIMTWQTLKNYPHLIKLFQMVVVDECIAGSSSILLANGYTKLIQDIVVNDTIMSFDEEAGYFVSDRVSKVHKNLLKSSDELMYELEFDNGNILQVTGNHLILTEGGYKRADQLTEEDEIINSG